MNRYTEINVDHNLSRLVTVNTDEFKSYVEKPKLRLSHTTITTRQTNRED